MINGRPSGPAAQPCHYTTRGKNHDSLYLRNEVKVTVVNVCACVCVRGVGGGGGGSIEFTRSSKWLVNEYR